jgi:3-hydroxyacyl-[acyl-carrier-protein] dehydratase
MTLTIQEIMDFLPHRYPFLLIDRVVEFEPAKRLVAIKNVTMNEPFFQGHFPGYPIMPGVLVVEAMAQAGGMIMMAELEDRQKKLVVFTGIERAKFRRPVTPGDQIRFEVNVLSFRTRAGRIEGKAFVDGKLACEAILTCQVVTREREQRAHGDPPQRPRLSEPPVAGDPGDALAADEAPATESVATSAGGAAVPASETS